MSRILLAALACSALPAGAVTTRTWTTASYKDFDAGEPERAVITSLGEVMPGRAIERVTLDSEAAWCAVRGADGTLYAGGVTDGAVYAVSGKSKRKVAALDKESPWIGALAVAPSGMLYAGTLGSGVVYAVDPRSGATRKVATLDAQHVWALAFDAAGKTLYAGTGPAGKLFAIDVAAGKAKLVWESGEKHLLSIARAADAALWIGTADEAILYRFDPRAGQARAIADFAGTEVKAVVEAGGAFVVAANEFEQKSTSPPGPPAPKTPKGTAAKAPEGGSAPGTEKTEGPSRSEGRKGKGALFRVDADGRTEQIHALPEGYYQALAATPDGNVYAASGTQGRVYLVKRDRTVVTAFDVTERQVNAVLVVPSGVAFATGDAGAVYQTAGPAKDARYTSKVFDAAFPARWGNLRWRGAGVVVETRSGNTGKPGKGWSAWQRVTAPEKAGGDATLGRIASPPGRYLQFRAGFDATAGAILRELSVYYLPQNQRARVTEVATGDPEAKKTPVTTQTGVTKPRSPILKLRWKVENPDEDELVYTLQARPEGTTEWVEIPTGVEPLTAMTFDWNTEALPDGYYRVRVTASDKKANPAETTLADSYVSAPILIDNLKPAVTLAAVQKGTASGRAQDSFSRIDEIAWQVDGGDWHVAFPQDRLFDNRVESFTFKLPVDLKPGLHTLTVRVADEADNIGSATTSFRLPK